MKRGKEKFHVANVSWGKDSVWMLEYLILTKARIDLVIFANTGFEFDAVYAVRDKFLEKLYALQIPYVEIDISEEFKRRMFSHEIHSLDGSIKVGYGWCGGPCRWGTCLKLESISRYYRLNLSQYDVVEYIGIAADEAERVNISAQEKGKKIYPLVSAGYTQWHNLSNCYKCGYTWEEDGRKLYDYLDRLSCWCCRNKNLKELKAMYYLFTKYWERLKKLQITLKEPMKGEGKSVFDLEERFKKQGWEINLLSDIELPFMKEDKDGNKDGKRKAHGMRECDHEGDMDLSGGYFYSRFDF